MKYLDPIFCSIACKTLKIFCSFTLSFYLLLSATLFDSYSEFLQFAPRPVHMAQISFFNRRLDSEYPVRNMFKLFICAICQVELKPNQGISVHEDSSQPGNLRRWDGPFLCQSCQEKKEAMEGKRRSRGIVCRAALI